MTDPVMNPWHPMTDAVDLKCLGKLGEELGECSAAVARCIIQGVYEREPVTLKRNDTWLSEEIADVLANIDLVCVRFHLDRDWITDRADRKRAQLTLWHGMA